MLNPKNEKTPIEQRKTARRRRKRHDHNKTEGTTPMGNREHRETVLLLVRMLVTIFLCEAAIMALLYVLPLKSGWHIVADPVLLAVLSTPLLYWLLVRPIRRSLEQRNSATEALQQSEQRYRSFVQSFQGIFYLGCLDFVPVFFHGKVKEITGYTEDEFTAGKPRWDQIIHPDDFAAISETVEKMRTIAGHATEWEYRILRKDKQVRWVYELVHNVCDDSGKPSLVQGAIYDITERKQIEEDLRKHREHLEELVLARTTELTEANKQLLEEIERRKELERDILRIVEQERQRIGQELHDSIGQQLTGIGFMMEVLGGKLADKSLTEEAPYAEKINTRVSRAVELARHLAKGLHPIDLDGNGLAFALKELAANTEQLFGVSCTFQCDKAVSVNGGSVAINLYRIAQEAITNAVKHGKAKNIRIELVSKDNGLRLTVENDGSEFPAGETRGGGMGLKIMRCRAEIVDGSFDIRKGTGEGSIVTCVFPNKENP
ncbi:MAG: PAS domain-containing protein [Phycisphaerales bacterium]|nr:MAG: PAS domain-containing protein [Phycisphaerales bacterium]